jgi:hypothetical protein
MALVKVLVKNLFAGANFQKLEVGMVYDVDDAIAENWIASNKAEKSADKKGEKLTFEVTTPSPPAPADTSALQSQLDEALAQVQALTDAATATETQHAEALAVEKKRADGAEAALAAAIKKDK